MPLVEVLSGNATEDSPETVAASGFIDGGLWNDLHLGCVGEEGEGGL